MTPTIRTVPDDACARGKSRDHNANERIATSEVRKSLVVQGTAGLAIYSSTLLK
jgi:hypothetical protein